jgi:pectate lyase
MKLCRSLRDASRLCLLICMLAGGSSAVAGGTDAWWYAMRNHGVKVGWMRLADRQLGDTLVMDDEVRFAAKGEQGHLTHHMQSRRDAVLTPLDFSLDVARPRKPWAITAQIAERTLTIRSQRGLKGTGSAPLAADFLTEFSAMRVVARGADQASRKFALLGAWEKPTVVDAELRYAGRETIEFDGRPLATERFVISNPETADRIYWRDAGGRLVRVQVFGRVVFELTDEAQAKADEAPPPPRAHQESQSPLVPAQTARGPLATADIPAFPGAAGFGSRTAGGRGGRVIEVTTLADDGPGSLRAALAESGPRIVVFRVGGSIRLTRPLEIRAGRVTVAGHSATGGGIMLRDAGLVVAADDVVLRYLRIRPGNRGPVDPENNDALQINGARNVVVDHVSMSWSEDEVVQVWEGAQDVSLSWCIFSEALNKSRHPKGRHGAGVLIGDGSERVTVHHSLLTQLDFRNPLIKDAGAVDLIENLVDGWGRTGGEAVDEIGRESHINVIGNRYVKGPASHAPAFVVNKGDSARAVYPRIFAQDNSGPAIGADTGDAFAMFSLGFEAQALPPAIRASQPFASPPVPRVGGAAVSEAVLAQAGANRPWRDAVDRRVVEAVRGARGTMINSPDEVGGFPELASAAAPRDSDHDGMPDAWEAGIGLAPQDASDAAKDRDGDGYSNVEEYLETLLAP